MRSMNPFRTILFIALLVLALSLGAGTIPQTGGLAPDFTLPSQDGTYVRLKDYRGKWVVLYFYPKDGTPGCTLEAHNFERDLAKYQQRNAVIVGMSVDAVKSHQEFCAKQGLTFKLVSDPEKRVVNQYGSLRSILGFGIAARNTFLIDPDGKISHVWTGVDPAHTSEEVLRALTAAAKERR